MEHPFALSTLLSLILLTTTDARTGPIVDGDIISEQLTIKIDASSNPEEYWRAITKNQLIPKALQALFRPDPPLPAFSKEIADCHTFSEKTNKKDKSFAKGFEPRPSISAHHDDEKKETSFVKDFEPRPSFLAHHEDGEPKKGDQYFKDFDPTPDTTIYQN